MAALGEIVVTFDEAEAKRLYLAGASLKTLGTRYHVAGATVKRRLLKLGVKPHVLTAPVYPFEWEQLKTECENGTPLYKLASKYPAASETIKQHLDELGVLFRGRGAKRHFGKRAKCKRCKIALDTMAYEEYGICCSCLAAPKIGYPLPKWIWADDVSAASD